MMEWWYYAHLFFDELIVTVVRTRFELKTGGFDRLPSMLCCAS